MKSSKAGFTLLELILVLVVLGILVSVALPKYADFVEKAKGAELLNTIGAIKTAQLIYRTNHDNFASGTLDTINSELGLKITPPGGTTYWTDGLDPNTGAPSNTVLYISAIKLYPSPTSTYIDFFYDITTGGSQWYGTHPATPGGIRPRS